MKTHRRGLSLPEILIVIMLMSILLTLGSVAFGVRDSVRLNSASSVITSHVRTAQDKTYSSDVAGVRITESHVSPLVRPEDYAEGLVNVRTTGVYTPDLVQWAIDNNLSIYNRLVVEQAVFNGVPGPAHPEGAPNNPTSWYWNVRLGETIVLGGVRYTICGPMLQDNPEKFVNVGPQQIDKTGKFRVSWSPLKRTYGDGTHPYSTEFLLLVNGKDDDRDGLIDSGWNGIDDNLDGVVDDDYEWETEHWATSAVSGLTNAPYHVVRSMVPTTRGQHELPANIIVDLSKSSVMGKTFADHIDLIFDRTGRISTKSVYSIDNTPLGERFVKLQISDRNRPQVGLQLTIDTRAGQVDATPTEPTE